MVAAEQISGLDLFLETADKPGEWGSVDYFVVSAHRQAEKFALARFGWAHGRPRRNPPDDDR